jgi:hypothetical protein
VTVVATVRGEVVGRTRCDLYREDLRDGGHGDGHYAFDLGLPSGLHPDSAFTVFVEDLHHRFELTFSPSAPDLLDGSTLARSEELGKEEDSDSRPVAPGMGFSGFQPALSHIAADELRPADPIRVDVAVAQITPAPQYLGYIDRVVMHSIEGWAMDLLDPVRRVTVVATVNGEVVGRARCDLYREDLRSGGYGDGRYAFHLDLPRRLELGSSFEVHVDDVDHPFELMLAPGAIKVDDDGHGHPGTLSGEDRADGDDAKADVTEHHSPGQTPVPTAALSDVDSLQITLGRLQQQIQRLQDQVAAVASIADSSTLPGAGPLIPPPPAETVSLKARGLYYRFLSTIR